MYPPILLAWTWLLLSTTHAYAFPVAPKQDNQPRSWISPENDVNRPIPPAPTTADGPGPGLFRRSIDNPGTSNEPASNTRGGSTRTVRSGHYHPYRPPAQGNSVSGSSWTSTNSRSSNTQSNSSRGTIRGASHQPPPYFPAPQSSTGSSLNPPPQTIPNFQSSNRGPNPPTQASNPISMTNTGHHQPNSPVTLDNMHEWGFQWPPPDGLA